MIPSRTLLLLLVIGGMFPATASADWLFIPFYGVTFGTDTSLVDLEGGTSRTKQVFGGSVSFLSAGLLGIEGDIGYIPGFFSRRDRDEFVASSRLLTLTGNVVITAPLSWTRESLRPYVLGGVGLMRAQANDLLDFVQIDNLISVDVGGGVMGFFNERTGVRFELRYFSSIGEPEGFTSSFGTARLSQWRATVGLVLRRTVF